MTLITRSAAAFAACLAALVLPAGAETNRSDFPVAGASSFRGTLNSATRTIFLDLDGNAVSVASPIAYHPGFGRYYGSGTGSPSVTGMVFGPSGGVPVSTVAPLNIDPRSWVYNANTAQLEVVSFNAISGGTDRGLILPGTDASGNLTGATTELLSDLPGLLGSQTAPAYDADADVFYSRSDSNTVNIVNRSDGSLIGSINLDFVAAGISSVPDDGIVHLPGFDLLGVVDQATDVVALFDTSGNFELAAQLDIDVNSGSRRPGFANGQLFVFDEGRAGWQGYEIPGLVTDGVFSDRFFQDELSTSGSWTCAIGTSCQDVYELDLESGAVVTIRVSDLTGSSNARIAAIAPGGSLDGDNVLLGTNSDRLCAAQGAEEEAQFFTDQAGTWQIAVVRDWARSGGASGTYSLSIASSLEFSGALTAVADDVESEAAGVLCDASYVVDSSWACQPGESCQDVFSLGLEAGSDVELAVTEVTGNSLPRLALHAPGVSLGDINLLTNTNEDRQCVGQDDSDFPAPYPVSSTGTHTLAVTRDWGLSAGSSGGFRLTISAGGENFVPPLFIDNDVDSLAPGGRCGWLFTTSSDWACTVLESCQDVFDIGLRSGSTLSAEVSAVTGASVVRLAAFAPGEPLSGTNLWTGSALDYSCGGQNGDASPPPLSISADGTYRIAFGRDWGTSAGGSGNYTASLVVQDGYGGAVVQTIDDVDSLSGGFICP